MCTLLSLCQRRFRLSFEQRFRDVVYKCLGTHTVFILQRLSILQESSARNAQLGSLPEDEDESFPLSPSRAHQVCSFRNETMKHAHLLHTCFMIDS